MSLGRSEPPRRPKGQQPVFFDDPAIDQLHAAVVALASELAVAFDRIDTLERLLEQRVGLARSSIDEFAPDEDLQRQRSARHADIAERVLRPFVDYRESLIQRAAHRDNPEDSQV